MTIRRSQRKMAAAVAASAGKQQRGEATSKTKVKRGSMARAATAVTLATAATAALPKGAAALSTSPYFAATRVLSSPSKTALLSAKSSKKSSPSPKKKKKSVVERTNSFEPLSAAMFPELNDANVKVHTLILGTHPSIASLSEAQYYGHPMNAFWWIAGDCLGFRRNTGISPSSGEPYKFTSQLRYGADRIIPYEDQIHLMASKGFAMWDVVGSCQREGSLDSAIEDEVPNDIAGFCKSCPSIRRIVLANGSTGSKYFVKHFKDWWESGELRPGENKESQTAFQRKAFAKATNNFENARITCVSAVSVSPAAAMYSYEQKRDFWETHVYQPGLKDFESYNN